MVMKGLSGLAAERVGLNDREAAGAGVALALNVTPAYASGGKAG